MKINRTEYYTEIEADDFTFLIQKDGSQISIEKDEGESLYIDLEMQELTAISEVIKEVVNESHSINDNVEVDKNEYERLLNKANSYDKLYEEISGCYGEENEEGEYIEDEESDLSTIGEIAASHFGFI